MPTILISALLILTIGLGFLGSSRYDPSEAHNSAVITSKMTAKNAFMYSSLLNQYAIAQPTITKALVNVNSLSGYASTGVHPLLNYQMIIITYRNQRYLINSWDISSKSGVNVADVLGDLAAIASTKIYQSDKTYWQVPVVGVNTSCNLSQASYIDPIKKNGTLALFNSLCNLTQANLGVALKKYVIFTPIINF